MVLFWLKVEVDDGIFTFSGVMKFCTKETEYGKEESLFSEVHNSYSTSNYYRVQPGADK